MFVSHRRLRGLAMSKFVALPTFEEPECEQRSACSIYSPSASHVLNDPSDINTRPGPSSVAVFSSMLFARNECIRASRQRSGPHPGCPGDILGK
ncbi:hypothetical protein C8Q73DRAFT_499970 [Cubamyces lactineus]|nr:hypothetical protein C8Q73DRAFT_499970 [Cubamyces lactineus]